MCKKHKLAVKIHDMLSLCDSTIRHHTLLSHDCMVSFWTIYFIQYLERREKRKKEKSPDQCNVESYEWFIFTNSSSFDFVFLIFLYLFLSRFCNWLWVALSECLRYHIVNNNRKHCSSSRDRSFTTYALSEFVRSKWRNSEKIEEIKLRIFSI